jgi:putative tryptophan/tyrosine transport system substrate-binding protein
MHLHWKRREFITLLSGAAVAWPLTARAQQPSPVRPMIGILSPLSASEITSAPFEAFRRALRDFGYVEGKNISFVYRWADGSPERLDEFATELVSSKVDVIFSAPGTPTAIAARRATASIPIVFAGAGDVVGTRLVANLALPAGNATGLVNQSQDVAGKQLQFLKEAIPSISRVGVLWRPSNPSYKNLLSRFDAVVRATGVKVVLIDVESRADLETAFETIKRSRIDGLLVQADDLFINEGTRIIELAAVYRVPAIYRLGYQATAGGLMAYGPNIPDMYRRAAFYVHKILKGAKPNDLPVEQPTKIELVINLKTATTLGLTIPLALQVAADEVIE